MNGDAVSLDETLGGDETLEGNESARAPRRRSSGLERGSMIGRYVVLERIGRGGMGIVHAAYDPTLDRKVAVKVLLARASTQAAEAGSQRLLREAQAMAQLRHPNVVGVHDVGVHEGHVFVAMEFVEGGTLRAWLDAQPRAQPEILDVFVQAGRGLAAAHAKGLVHRDFKPENVMVGEGPRAQVMDFGLVRALDSGDDLASADVDDLIPTASSSLRSQLTHAGQLLGTPSYMAPEQFAQDEVDARTDQFSFCVALWEALFDAHPFGGDSPMELAIQVTSGLFAPLPSSAVASARLRRVLERGMSVERHDRWPSMDALLAALMDDPSRRRRRWLLAGAGIAVVGLAVGGERLHHAAAVRECTRAGAALVERTWTDDARARVREGMVATGLVRAAESYDRFEPWIDRYAARWQEARTQACMNVEVEARWSDEQGAAAIDCLEQDREELGALLDVLADADDGSVDDAVLQAAGLPAPSRCVDERYLVHRPPSPADPQQQAEQDDLRQRLVRAARLAGAGRVSEAQAVLDELRSRVDAAGSAPLLIRYTHVEALVAFAASRWDAARERFRAAFVLALEHDRPAEAGDAAQALAGLTGNELSNPEEGLWWADVAQSLARRIGEDAEGMRIHGILRVQSGLHQLRGEFEPARALAEQALAMSEAMLGPDHPRVAADLRRLASIMGQQGELTAAEALARRSVALREATLGLEHPHVVLALDELGKILYGQGKIDEALETFERSVALAERIFPADHPRLGQVRINLGSVL
ncbi:MAG: serine/threonine protein kinase, partial [Myxococcales bacterium]|nr:serine/threonine protein kinase [Myxococcales bacterium]